MTSFRGWLSRMVGGKEEPDMAFSQYAQWLPGGAEPLAEDNNDFAVAMYDYLRQGPGNLFFSPFSVRLALGMAQAGARGETARQMRQALRVTSSSDEAFHSACAEIIARLNGHDADYELTVANSLWCQDGAPLQPEFRDLIDRDYGGDIYLVDFSRDAEAARITMNQWIEDKTRQRIRGLISSGSLNASTRLVLLNAVYFRGTWMQPFLRAATTDQPFHLEDDRQVPVPLMYQKEATRYLQAQGYQAVELFYQGGDLSMLLLLPDRKDGLKDIEATLSARMLHECLTKMAVRQVELFLPRFNIALEAIHLRPQLAALGMPLAFTPSQADFSGINGHLPPDKGALSLSVVAHKAFVTVNEEGTEAAAATLVDLLLVRRPSEPAPIFRADHPFLFAIRHRPSGTVLFVGRMTDPTQES
jgi:serpin B